MVCYGDRLESPSDLATDRLFTGQRLDDTGLYYYNARYYDSTIGRFISADTIVPDPSNPQAFNRYSYCYNNPTTYIDPDGHFAFIPVLAFIAYAAITGAAVDAAFQIGGNLINGQGAFDNFSFTQMGIAAGISVATAGVVKIPGVNRAIGAVSKPVSKATGAVGRSASGAMSRISSKVAPRLGQVMRGEGGYLRLGGQPSIQALRKRAVREAWRQEANLVRTTERGTRRWTKMEMQELLQTGRVKGYVGHHIRSVAKYPQWAGNPNNVAFLRKTGEHLQVHGGNWRNPTWGDILKR
ncbi:RHS repeat-associated core domain-containing protein [Chloroflexota bacterium]